MQCAQEPGWTKKESDRPATATRRIASFIRRTSDCVNGGADAAPVCEGRSGVRAVNGGVERRVVVHLELAINLETALPEEGLLPEVVEAGGEVVALLGEDGEALEVALSVTGGCVGPLGLLAGVKDFEGEDGETVNDEAGRLGVERCGGIGKAARREHVEQSAIQGFGEVIAELIGRVDAALDGGNFRVRSAGCAGFVLDVPEVEVGAVLAGDGFKEWVGLTGGSAGGLVPESGETVLESGDGMT